MYRLSFARASSRFALSFSNLLPTPALGSSRVNTPLGIDETKILPLGAKRHAISEVVGEARGGKKARWT